MLGLLILGMMRMLQIRDMEEGGVGVSGDAAVPNLRQKGSDELLTFQKKSCSNA